MNRRRIRRALVSIILLLGVGYGAHYFSPEQQHQRLLRLAIQRSASQQWREAEVAIRKALEWKPRDVKTRETLAEILLAEGKAEAALQQFGQLLIEHPEEQRFERFFSLVNQRGIRAGLDRLGARLRQQLPPADSWWADLLRAHAALADRRWKQARRYLEHGSRRRPGNRMLRSEWFRLYMAEGKPRRALAIAESWLKTHPADRQAQLARIAALQASGATRRAYNELSALIMKDASPTSSMLLAAFRMALDLGELRDADMFRQIVRTRFPSNKAGALLSMRLAILQGRRSQFFRLVAQREADLSITDLDQLMIWSLQHGHPAWALALYDRFGKPRPDNALLRLARFEALLATKDANRIASMVATEPNPSCRRYMQAVADLLRFRYGPAAEAFRRLKHDLASRTDGKPEDRLLRQQLSRLAEDRLRAAMALSDHMRHMSIPEQLRILLVRNQGREVLKALEHIDRMTGDLELLRILALYQTGNADQANHRLVDAIRRYPDHAGLLVLYGREFGAQRPAVVMQRIESFLARHPAGNAPLLSLQGELIARQAGVQAAEPVWARAVAVDPSFTPAWVLLGQARMALGDWRGAKEAWSHVLRAVPGDPDASNNLAFCLYRLHEHPERALALVRDALTRDPARVEYLDTEALIFDALGKSDEARRARKKIARLQARNATQKTLP